jgi:uncharacterized delta-60 repeat protein
MSIKCNFVNIHSATLRQVDQTDQSSPRTGYKIKKEKMKMNEKQNTPLVSGRKAIFMHLKGITWKASLLVTLISLMTVTVALAGSGNLDTSFDGDGLVITDVNAAHPGRNDVASDIALQSDGKIVAAGYSFIPSTATMDFAISRYTTDGSPDSTFSGDGKLITNFGAEDAVFSVAVQSNGKIVVAGNKCSNDICDLALARYNPNGKLDVTFSGDGKLITDIGGKDNSTYGGLAIQPDGKIVVTGQSFNGVGYHFAVYRYNANGTPDTTFSGDGKLSFGFGVGKQDFGEDLALQSDGKIVVVGETCANSDCDFAVARLTATGALDKTFSGDGKQIINMGGFDVPRCMILQPDGKMVLAGYKRVAAGTYFALVRLNTNGSLDTNFSGTGRKVINMGNGSYSLITDMSVQSDGKIVAFGVTKVGTAYDFALARLNANGALDSTFSGDGKLTVDFGHDEGAYGLAQQADGSYVLAGYADNGTQLDFALARVLP